MVVLEHDLCIEKNKKIYFQNHMVEWYERNGREFSWRAQELTGWKWLVLEILLKKTRAETVDQHYEGFINRYSGPEVLYKANTDELKADLKKFGLFGQRFEALSLIAKTIVEKYDGSFEDYLFNSDIKDMKHIGLYTYNATLCFHFGVRKPLVDVNVARIITRYLNIKMPSDLRATWIWCISQKFLPPVDFVEFNYGLLDFGALVCKAKPLCVNCPLKGCCGSAYLQQE